MIPSTPIEHPLVRATARRRRRLLVALLVVDLLLVIAVSSLRLHAEPGEASVRVLGYDLTTRSLEARTFLSMGVLIALQMLLGGRAVGRALAAAGAVQIHPVDETGGASCGDMTTTEIRDTVLELAAASGAGRVQRIVLVPEPVPNAFTAWIPGRGSVVALHSNLFDFLPREGIRAVIAHEVAHMKRGDSLVRQVTTAPGVFVMVVFSILAVQATAGALASTGFLNLLARLVFLALIVGLAFVALGFVARLAMLAARQAELLADAHAASLCGLGTMANTLLLLGERTEALAMLMVSHRQLVAREEDDGRAPTVREMRRFLARFPPWELSEENAREVAPRLFVQDRLEILRDCYAVPLSSEEIERLSSQAAFEMARASAGQEETTPPSPAPQPARWRAFDVDASGHLDDAELERLVAELERDPGRMLFRQFLTPSSRGNDHPSVRERILFLMKVHRA